MNRIRATLVVVVAALSACSPAEQVTSPEGEPLSVRYGRAVASPAYAPADLGVWPGDNEAYAWAVNDAGSVAIQSNLYPAGAMTVAHWYVRTGSVSTRLDDGGIRAVSGGPVTHVVGFASTGARWTYSVSGGFSSPAEMPLVDGRAGHPRAVNEAGDVTGSASYYDGTNRGDAVIWKIDGTSFSIANPDPALYIFGEGRDINIQGDAALSFRGVTGSPDRGFVRLADGSIIGFPPLAGHRSTYVYGVSDRSGGKIYVGGISDDDNGRYNAVRWTVDVTTEAITAEVGSAGSTTAAISNDGTIAGNLNGASTSAFVWKTGGSITALKTPKGSGNGRTWGISGNGRYISGDAKFGSYRRAVLWTAGQ